MVDERKEKLCGLAPEVLADALLDLAGLYDEAENLVERLLAPADSAESRIKGTIKALKRQTTFYNWNLTRPLVAELHMLLSDIASSIQDTQIGVDLVLGFYETDATVFEHCDDSDGYVGDVYRYEAPELFVRYAKEFTNRGDLLARIKTLVAADGYGVRDSILTNANEWLTPSEMRTLAADGLACAQAEPDEYRRLHWLGMAKTMARCLKDGALFEQLCWASSDELGAATRVDIAEVYLAGSDYAKALDHLQQVVEDGWFQHHRRDELRLRIYQQMGNDTDAHALAWTIFHRSGGIEALENLLKVIGESQRKEVIAQEVERILTVSEFSVFDADFLLQTGHMEQCANYVERHAGQVDGDNYYSLPAIANTLQSSGYLLAATIVFRALLVSLLKRGYTKAYRHGAQYLHQLNVMAPGVVDRQGIVDHQTFHQRLKDQHGRKRSFWAQVEITRAAC